MENLLLGEVLGGVFWTCVVSLYFCISLWFYYSEELPDGGVWPRVVFLCSCISVWLYRWYSYSTITRGNAMSLKRQKCKTLARRRYFSIWVVDHWNKLLPSAVGSRSVDSLFLLSSSKKKTLLTYFCIFFR